jgi:hypothetical protein
MQSFTLLRNLSDWHAYKAASVDNYGLHGVTDWGAGPQRFPCLVSSCPIGTSRLASCYVYPADALFLLAAAKELLPADEAGTDRRQDRFNKSAAAMFMTLVELLVDTGIVTPAVFEERHVRSLARVDQIGAADRDELLRVEAMLGRLGGG